MKKTITLLLAVSALASAAHAATVFTYETTQKGDSHASVHGFQLSLSSGSLSPSNADSPATLTGNVQLDQLTITGRSDNTGGAVTYGLLVLNLDDNTVVGKSTGTGTSGANINLTFNFSATDGVSSLILNASSTYRFLMVTQATLDLVQGAPGITYLYNAGGTGAATAAGEGTDTLTISQGLAAPGVKVQTGGTADDKCNFITGANGQSLGNNSGNYWAPVLTDIQVTQVPEPATASLSLIGLAALMMRRRRA